MTASVSRWAIGAALALTSLLASDAAAQAPRVPGPVIEPWGPTFDAPPTAVMPPKNLDLKVAFDVADANADPARVTTGLDTVARFINMHVRAGLPLEKVNAAVVIHGTAARDTLGNAAYRKRYGIDNPNLPLLAALGRAGVRIYLCAQSAAGRGIQWDEIAPEVQVALSAMTAHAMLAREGYTTNPF